MFDVCTSSENIMIVHDKHVLGRRRKRYKIKQTKQSQHYYKRIIY